MRKLRIMLAEDHRTVREGIKLLVNSQPDMEVVGEAESGAAAIAEVAGLEPDIVLMDISMPGLNGLRATRKIKQLRPEVKVLTLTRHADETYLQELISAGASGYVLKQSEPSELIRAIRTVGEGNSFLDSSLTDKVLGTYAGRPLALRGEGRPALTEREAEVFRLIAWGYSNKEIAAALDVSVKTVEAHKANAMRKLDMANRIDIVRFAVLQGWLQDT